MGGRAARMFELRRRKASQKRRRLNALNRAINPANPTTHFVLSRASITKEIWLFKFKLCDAISLTEGQ